MMEKRKKILITGGNGYVASRLAQHYLSQQPQTDVVLWLHADAAAEFEHKRSKLETYFHDFDGRIEYRAGNLVAAEPFVEVDPKAIDIVVHAAAVTRFNVEQDLAQQVNVDGTEKLLKFCERCRNLERVALLSTVYSSGLRQGAIDETAFDSRYGFANYYESSKWAAETMLMTRYGHLPWQIFRIATIIADDNKGVVSQYNAFHNTLKLLYYGLLPILPGKPDTPLYFVTGQFVTESIFTLLLRAPLHGIYHVTHAREESLSLGKLLELTFSTFSRESDFSRRRVMRPLYTDEQSFARLADSIQGLSGTVIKQAVASVTPFSKQLFFRKEVQNARMVSYLQSYRAPDQRQLVEKVCTYLMQTRWGREAAGSASRQALSA
ncbi:MAG: SDR family oxidoreductase [Gammaproteobacteria bacterium]